MTQDAIEIRPLSPNLLAVAMTSAESTPLFTALRSARTEHEDRGVPLPAVGLDMRCTCSPSMLRSMIRAVERAGFAFRGVLPPDGKNAAAIAELQVPVIAPEPVVPETPPAVAIAVSATPIINSPAPASTSSVSAARRRRARFSTPAPDQASPVAPVSPEATVGSAVVTPSSVSGEGLGDGVAVSQSVEVLPETALIQEEPVRPQAAASFEAPALSEEPSISAVAPAREHTESAPSLDSAASSGAPMLMPANPDHVVTPSLGAQLFTGKLKPRQRFHASMRDLIVSGSVASEAEVSADGSVHIYGEMRGRVMAGAAGDQRARVYCLEFYAELVIIAGYFNDFKSVRDQIEGRSVEIWLEDGELRVRSLGETDD